MTDCIFCKIVSGDIPAAQIYKNERTMAFLDIRPVNFGHTLVIPLNHARDLMSLDDDIACELFRVVKVLAPAVIKAVGAPAFNIALNNGPEAGQVIFHPHAHIIPRFAADGLKLWPGKSYAPGQMEKIAGEISKNLKE